MCRTAGEYRTRRVARRCGDPRANRFPVLRRSKRAALTAAVAVVAFGVSLAAVLSLGGTDGQAASSGSPPVPGSSWTKVAAAKVGLDAAKLNQIAATAKKGKSSCLVVVRNGKLAGEWYFKGTGPDSEQDVFSVTKSFASTLVGIAQDEGKLRIGSSASTWIPEWKGTPPRRSRFATC
jgi:CubicO group peptidase (beta-lactamase class C family)